MRERPSGHRIQVELGVEPETVDSRPDVETPFCVALFGDFSGRGHRGSPAGGTFETREPILVDRDNLDEVIARLQPEVCVPLQSARDPAVRVQFRNLEDFHPDRLYERLPLFEGVRELRRQLVEPARAAQPRVTPTAAPPSPPPPVRGDLLDQIVQQSQFPSSTEARPPLEGGDLQAYLNRIVAPHVVRAADPRRLELLAGLDAAAAAGMRALLHHADFQDLEALWRGVRMLAEGVESDTDVRLYLFDVTKAELSPDAGRTRLHQLLIDAAPDAGWGALAGLYSFGPEAADLELVGSLGAVACRVRAPWISAADARLVGRDNWGAEPNPEWQAVRRLPAARWIGLAMPRLLLRLPYGEGGSRCEVLPFEELSESPAQGEYLWGNPVLACLLLLIRSVAQSGRPVHPGMSLEIGGLPLPAAQPCLEALLGATAVERIVDHGLMPLATIRDTDRIRLLRFQSIADPTAALGDAWGGPPAGEG